MKDAPSAVIAIRKLNKTTGAARIALQQVSILSDMGYRVYVLCEDADKKIITSYGGEWKKISKLPFKGLIRRRWFNARVNAWCLRHKPSLVIGHGDTKSAEIIFMHNCVDLAQEVIYPGISPCPSDVSEMHRKILTQETFKLVVANSKLMANDLMSRHAIPADKIAVSYPGFDAQQFNTSIKESYRETKRDELGIHHQDKLIGLVTSGDFKKRNVDLFIDIAEILLKKSSEKYRFLIIGQGSVEAYQEKTKRLNIDAHFIWQKTVHDVEQYYAALDLFILPAHIEEFGCVVLEAMACSTLPLISERVGAGELLKGDQRELIVAGYDPYQWAGKVETLLNQDNTLLTQQMTQSVRNFDYQYQYKALQSLLSKYL